jgi:phytoene dehydrogenase-like protein
MDSGSIFGGYYGFVKGGIWQITEELGRINDELGVNTHLSSHVVEVDVGAGKLSFEESNGERSLNFDQLILATDPLTAARLVGSGRQKQDVEKIRYRGSSGKLNLMFKNPVCWKDGSDMSDSDTAFRFVFSVDTIDDFERATVGVIDDEVAYQPGYMQIYCEGSAMRQLNHAEPFDRLAVFFKNLALSDIGEQLPEVEERVRSTVLERITNSQDCVWSRLLTPKDLQELFHFPGGNLDHTMLTGGQTFFDRTFSSNPATNFYNFGDLQNVYMCASGTYPCGSVAGTPGYMCSQQLLRNL